MIVTTLVLVLALGYALPDLAHIDEPYPPAQIIPEPGGADAKHFLGDDNRELRPQTPGVPALKRSAG